VFKPEKIAAFHCELFRLHDEKRWREFENSVVNYAKELGYDRTAAGRAAPHVVSAYQNSDLAVDAQKDMNRTLEMLHYDRVLEEFTEAHRLLGAETRSPVYKVGWYIGARHRNHLQVLGNLFMEHHSKFGLGRLGLTVRTTYMTFAKAYPAHNSHDWEALTAVLTDYWAAVSKSYRTYKLPIEL
jgi:hypothetical protein